MSSSVPYDPYIPSGDSNNQTQSNSRTAALQSVSSGDFVFDV